MLEKKYKVTYWNKYDPQNKGLRAVFDHVYTKELKDFGIKSNMVAVSGESIDVYIDKYIPEIVGNIGKAVIMETNKSRLKRLRIELRKSKTKIKRKIKIVRGNVIGYEMNPLVNKFIKTPARFLDLGIGCGIGDLAQMGRLMLHYQQKVSKGRKKKVIILNAARRGVSDLNCIRHLNSFLESIDQSIISINGQKITKLQGVFRCGKSLSNSFSEIKQPMNHTVVLKDNNRKASLSLYTYTNGSSMLTAVLKYK